MEFRKYPSIENSYRNKSITDIKKFGFDLGTWIVLNKVHGANFSIWCDGENILYAKRTSFITDEKEKFYGYKRVVAEYTDAVYKIYDYFTEKLGGCKEVVLYGEILGGSYPHPDVKHSNQSTKVQKGVFYCPTNEFYLFDISVDKRYIPHDEVVELGKMFEFIYAKPLFKGSFEDCLNFDPVFEDPLYKEFNLPKIDNNISEGIVLKPILPAFFPVGSRAILKKKNPKFMEKTRKKKKVKKDVPEHIKEKIELISQYVTENRLRNVLSHGLDIKEKDFGVLMKAFVEDVVEDYEKENGSLYNGIEDKKEKKMVTGPLNKMCSNLIRPHFMNIIDKEF